MVKKGTLLIAAIALILGVSCNNKKGEKSEKKAEKEVISQKKRKSLQSQKLPREDVFHGKYIYTDSAAVLKGSNYIYGVQLDSMARRLAELIEPRKEEKYQMFPVVVRGKLQSNPNEGWEQILTIKEVLAIQEPEKSKTLKVGSKQNSLNQ